jgi:glycosyltransferase involved in cell wall biosynthesis
MTEESLAQLDAISDVAGGKALPGGLSIVYFGNDWFAENRTSSHHIARWLGERFPVLYIETPGMRAPSASRRDFKKLWRKLSRALHPPQRVARQMWVMTMPQIPYRRWPFIGQLNKLYGRYIVRRAMRLLGFRQVVSWFVVPHPGALARQLGERFVVYYCIDDYSGLPDVDCVEIARLDAALTSTADQVFAASTTLLERKRKIRPATVFSPHGVDFDHFQKADAPATPVPEEARNLRHPVIGFFGSIGGWVDVDLLLDLARSKPEWTLLMIGLVSADVRELRNCPNVVFAGAQPYERLPEWAKAFDVAILPYRLSQGSISANPLKLREYLATGKPVVAVSTPEVDRFAHCVRIAHNRDEFLRKVEDALTNDSEAQKQARIDEVTGCTWEARAAEVLNVVAAGMAEKHAGS